MRKVHKRITIKGRYRFTSRFRILCQRGELYWDKSTISKEVTCKRCLKIMEGK